MQWLPSNNRNSVCKYVVCSIQKNLQYLAQYHPIIANALRLYNEISSKKLSYHGARNKNTNRKHLPVYLNFHVTTSSAKSLEAAQDNYQLFLQYANDHIYLQGLWVCLLLLIEGEVELQAPVELSSNHHNLLRLLCEGLQSQLQESDPEHRLYLLLWVWSKLLQILHSKPPERNEKMNHHESKFNFNQIYMQGQISLLSIQFNYCLMSMWRRRIFFRNRKVTFTRMYKHTRKKGKNKWEDTMRQKT